MKKLILITGLLAFAMASSCFAKSLRLVNNKDTNANVFVLYTVCRHGNIELKDSSGKKINIKDGYALQPGSHITIILTNSISHYADCSVGTYTSFNKNKYILSTEFINHDDHRITMNNYWITPHAGITAVIVDGINALETSIQKT